MGGTRVQYSMYLFEGEPHECERVIRYMRRVAAQIPGDIRLLPMDRTVWESQIIISAIFAEGNSEAVAFPQFVKFW